ncbi:MAG: pseudouridine synthase, partial [Alphaproteobacteria bacterium]
TIDGIHYRGMKIAVEKEQSGGRNHWLAVTLKEGKNREIRRIFEHLDLPVSRLIRTHYAGIALGDLPPGSTRKIPSAITRKLADQLGVTSCA